MICPKCGSEVTEEANFCPDCGEKLKPDPAAGAQNQTQGSEALAAETQETPNQEKSASLKKTVKHSLKLSHRTARVIALITLVLALGSSIAYAAFYVYQNVYLPSQQSETASSSTDKDSEPNYQITDKTIKVSVPSTEADGKRKNEVWHYDELTCGDANKATEAINATVKEAIAKTAKDTEGQNKELIDCTLTREIKITYISDDYVCYVDCQDFTNGGVVTRARYSVYFDLRTGKSVKPSTAIGQSTEELIKKSKTAVKIYLEDNPEKSDDETLNQEAVSQINLKPYKNDLGLESSLLLTNKGLIWISSTAMLRYSGEIAHIVVEPHSNDLSIGDDIDRIPPLYLSPDENNEQ